MSKYMFPVVIGLISIVPSSPVMAASTFGGIVFTDFYYVSKDAANNSGGVINGATADADSFSATRVELPNITRIRASWSNEDDVGLYAELGLGGSSGNTSVSTRHAYGTYQFTDRWQILAGHSSSPFSPLFPNQLIGNSAASSASGSAAFGSITTADRIGGNHNVGKGYGELDSGRNPQVRLTYSLPSQRGAIAIAILDANQGTAITGLSASTPTAPARDSKIPRIDIGGAYNFYGVRLFPGVSYQKQTYNGVVGGADNTVTAWATSFGLQTGKGPFEVSAELNYGLNWRNTGFSLGNSAAALGGGAYTAGAGTIIQDTKNLSYWIDLGWRINTANTQSVIHLVYGAMKSEASDPATTAQDFSHKSTMFGVSWPIDMPWIARGFTVRPELFIYDEGRSKQGASTVDYGKEKVGGVQLQYTF